ncbi:flagellar filament capping protein FliD [Halodesulfovibrio sp.]|jgi:flagellar hook-associated protein 2|uniref:flagellar filament capping protein FliD n=1 Tax=Halodesulfovibrio sp. TaxID=1912772 RepID=UPI0025FFC0DC|nr:flagellar filament capping protein FliD [Halodesulfovibrio sp.]MCT4627274.1 flagellar filament capping protein FliD [Halodesulfovibrio sp.]
MSDYWSGQKVYAGFATKTDFNSIIDATVKMEKFRYNQLSKQEAETNFKKEQIAGLNRTMQTYKKQLESMDTVEEFLVKKGTSSKTDIASVKVSASAQEGTHNLKVTQLADVASVVSTDMDKVAYTGADKTITFKYDGKAYSLDLKKDMTTEELATAINKATAGKVKASVIDLGTGKFKLQMRGMELGKDHNFTEFDELKAILGGGDAANTTVNDSKNAKFTLDGIDIERETNSVDDVTKGVTYNLVALGDTVAKVETDYDAIVKNVENFVKLTNELRTGFKLIKDYKNEELDKKGVNYSLKTNPEIRNIETSLKNILSTQGIGFVGGNGEGQDLYIGLSSLGIKTIAETGAKDFGMLEFNKDERLVSNSKETFMDYLKANPEAVANLFAAEGYGSSSDTSVLEFNSSMYSVKLTEPGSYKVEYDGEKLPTTGDENTISMTVNGTTSHVVYNAVTKVATIDEGVGAGISFKVIDTAAGSHSATLSVHEGKVRETIKVVEEITAKGGVFDKMDEKYKNTIDHPVYGLKKKMEDELARVKSLEKRLIAQYSKTEKLLGQYQNIQKMLDFQLKSQIADKD